MHIVGTGATATEAMGGMPWEPAVHQNVSAAAICLAGLPLCPHCCGVLLA